MTRALGPLQCTQLTCEYYWDGNQWNPVGGANHCGDVANCTCPGAPEKPPPNTKPFYQFVQCMPTVGRKAKAEPATVRIHVTPDVEVCLICVPKHRRRRRR